MQVEWKQAEKKGERYDRADGLGSVAEITSGWWWLAGGLVMGPSVSGVASSRAEAEQCIEIALPILRDAKARLTDALHDREALLATVAAS